MNDSTSVGKRIQNLQIGPEFNTYTMVILHVGQVTDDEGNTYDLDFVAGNTVGRTLELNDPMGTQQKANALLAKLQNSKWQYQPYTGKGALLDPAAELGDGITLSDTFSAIYRRKVNFNSLMAADLEGPSDEEIDHEFPYIPKENRTFKREAQFTRSQLKINANEIAAEVSRATASEGQLSSRITINANAITTEVSRAKTAEGNLSSRITQNASAITAEVSRAQTAEGTKLNHTRTNSTFGWKLTADGFYLNSNGSKNVFTCTKDGIIIQGNATVTGKIQATSGFIGSTAGNGFSITSTGLYNGKASLENGNQGVYIGRDGIALGAVNGASAFKVTSNGAVTARNLSIEGGSINMKDGSGNIAFRVTSGGDVMARNMTLRGNLYMQNADGGNQKVISADTLAVYADRGNSANSWITGDVGNGTSRGTYCVNGAGGGYAFNNATNSQSGSYPGYFKATSIYCDELRHSGNGDLMLDGQFANWGAGFVVEDISVSKRTIDGTVVVTDVSKSRKYIHYLKRSYYDD